jgi:VIT1/CCC1 family predicted Fe2+/Mn2+ transporter
MHIYINSIIMSEIHLHLEEHMKSTDLLSDIVIGMSDGLTVPFALAAGLSGAVEGHVNLIWIAGIAEVAAGSIAMGLGGYLAILKVKSLELIHGGVVLK